MTTEERLDKLERELARAKRRNCWLLAAVGMAVAVFTLAWTWNKTTPAAQAQGAAPAPKTIRANKFILEDENGNIRAILAADKDGPALHLFDETGKARVGLRVDKDGPGLLMTDDNGKPRSILSVDKDGPGLRLYDGDGRCLWQAKDKKVVQVLEMPQTKPPKSNICPECNGSGTSRRVCGLCNGTGKNEGFSCRFCRGGVKECGVCRGTGHTSK